MKSRSSSKRPWLQRTCTSMRYAGEFGKRLPGTRVEGQRHQRGARLDDAQAELSSNAVAEVGRADLRDRESSGGDHHARRPQHASIGVEFVALRVAPHGAHRARHAPLHVAGAAFGLQHRDDLLGAVVAEKLPLVLLVEGDAMALHQFDEVGRRVARECGARELRILGEVAVVAAGIDVGEVAASAAGDADLLCRASRRVRSAPRARRVARRPPRTSCRRPRHR